MIAGADVLPLLTPTKPASNNPASAVAEIVTRRDYFSWSALSTFRTCALKYRVRYLDGLPEGSASSALVCGTGIHSAVEQHVQATLSGDLKPELDALLFAYRRGALSGVGAGYAESILTPRRGFANRPVRGRIADGCDGPSTKCDEPQHQTTGGLIRAGKASVPPPDMPTASAATPEGPPLQS